MIEIQIYQQVIEWSETMGMILFYYAESICDCDTDPNVENCMDSRAKDQNIQQTLLKISKSVFLELQKLSFCTFRVFGWMTN